MNLSEQDEFKRYLDRLHLWTTNTAVMATTLIWISLISFSDPDNTLALIIGLVITITLIPTAVHWTLRVVLTMYYGKPDDSR